MNCVKGELYVKDELYGLIIFFSDWRPGIGLPVEYQHVICLPLFMLGPLKNSKMNVWRM